MTRTSIESLKIKAKLLQKAKKKAGKNIALKDAYGILAKAAGFSSWKEMKDSYEISDLMNPPQWSAQWKVWFSLKNEALLFQRENGGYLIPYRDQYFVCDHHYIEALGIANEDQDLLKVGYDWSAPLDLKAWESILQKIKNTHFHEVTLERDKQPHKSLSK